MLSNVIVGTFCIEELHTLKTSRRHILHVFGPSNALGLEQIHNSGYVGWNIEQVIVVHPKIFPSNNGDIVRFGSVCQGEIVGQEDSLFSQSGNIGWKGDVKMC